MKKRQLAVVGGGQMGRALVGGMLTRGVLATGDIRVVEPSAESQAWWAGHHPEVALGDDLNQAVEWADTVLLAVKPHIIPEVARQEDGFWRERLVISIAAGVQLKNLCDWVGHQRVARVMPNTPCLVGSGASAFCGAREIGDDDARWIHAMLSSVGLAFEVGEEQMDAVTGLSGSGPAYVYMVIEAMADGGVLAGLPRRLAMELATQTVLGAAQMVSNTGRHPGELKDAVTSPAGTTIAAVAALEENGLRSALIEAVATSAQRSRQLGAE